MADPFIEKMVADALMKQLSQEEKDSIVKRYIESNIFGIGNFDSIVRDPLREHFRKAIGSAFEKQISQKHDELDKIAKEVIAEELGDKTLIKEWLHKRLLERAAKNIQGW